MVQHDMAGTSADYLGVGWVSDLSTVQYPTVVHVAFFLSFLLSFSLAGQIQTPFPTFPAAVISVFSHISLADHGQVEKRALNGDAKGDAC